MLFRFCLILLAFSAPCVAQLMDYQYDSLQDLYDSTGGNTWIWNSLTTTIVGKPWNFNDGSDPCLNHWQGVNCSCSENNICAVEILELSGYNLTGTLPSSIGELYSIEILTLSSNHISGSIPYNIGYLTNLTYLNLYDNYLSGTIPGFIKKLVNLFYLDFSYNFLRGTIPGSKISSMVSLEYLVLGTNYFTGTIPDSLFTLPLLYYLDLSNNLLYGSFLENQIIVTSSMITLYLDKNHLTGTIPAALAHMTSLQYLVLSSNKMHGTIPNSLFSLPDTYYLDLSNNLFHGSFLQNEAIVPSSIALLNLHGNELTGTIPRAMANMTYVEYLDLSSNRMFGTIPDFIVTLLGLEQVYLYRNSFTGIVPDFSKLTNLYTLDLHNNSLSGRVLEYYDDIDSGNFNLREIILNNNSFSGTIPSCLFESESIVKFKIANNWFSGTLPSNALVSTRMVELSVSSNSLFGPLPQINGNCSQLSSFDIGDNAFTGTIPDALFVNCYFLTNINLGGTRLVGSNKLDILFYSNFFSIEKIVMSKTQLNGTIPTNIRFFSYSLKLFNIGNTSTSGTIPSEITYLTALQTFNVSANKYMHGSIPEDIGNCTSLQYFIAYQSQLTGTVPHSIGKLSNLSVLSLGNNQLGGRLPLSLNNCTKLKALDLSSNHFSGPIPPGIMYNLTKLNVVYLQNNRFSGEVVSADIYKTTNFSKLTLTNVDFSHNRFTGTIPRQLFEIDSLVTFAIVNNCVDQATVPYEVCKAKHLEVLALDGINESTQCGRLKTFLQKTVGTIPACIFTMPSLTTFHLSGNRVTGTIPVYDTLSSTLLDLTLSYNELTGTIPHAIQSRKWYNLDLSYNKFTGVLSSNFTEIPRNSTVKLAVNRLSGSIPQAFFTAQGNISVLEGNIFGCDYETKSIPSKDSYSTKYTCGTNSVNSMLYAWVGIIIALTAIVIVKYRAEFLKLVFLTSARSSATDPFELLRSLQFVFLKMTLSVLVILLPVYFAISLNYGMYTRLYGWICTAVYLHGVDAAAVVILMWSGQLVLMFFVFDGVIFHPVLTSKAAQEAMTAGKKVVKFIRSKGKLMAVVLFSNLIVLAVNGGYVYFELDFPSRVLIIAQLILAAFKIFWSSYAIPGLIHLAVGDGEKQDQNNSLKKIFRTHTTMEALLTLFSSAIAPCVAIAAANVNCFLRLWQPAKDVKANYSSITCNGYTEISYFFGYGLEYTIDTDECAIEVTSTVETSYTPPFTYSYQCSSALVASYVGVFIQMYALNTFAVPLLQYLVSKYCSHMPRILYVLGPPKTWRDSRKIFIIQFVSNTALFMTFGVIYPPLAVIICFSTCIEIGRLCQFMQFCDEWQDISTVEEREMMFLIKLANVRRVLSDLVWYLFPFANLFFGLFLFDITGDTRGWKRGTVASILMAIIPICILVLYEQVRKRLGRNAVNVMTDDKLALRLESADNPMSSNQFCPHSEL